MKTKKTRVILFAVVSFIFIGLAVTTFSLLQSQHADTDPQTASISGSENVGTNGASPETTSLGNEAAESLAEPAQSHDLTQTYEEAVAELCAEVGQVECERLLGSMEDGESESPTADASGSPRPTKSSTPVSESPEVFRGAPPKFNLDQPKYIEPKYKECPKTREESPTDYDRCHNGYEAPRIEWVGYLSCRKFVDPKFGEIVEVFGRIQLIGGNFLSSDWGPQSELLGENSYRIVSSANTEAPYFLIWSDYIRIAPMDDAYMSWIDEVGGNGAHLIQASQMDPACLQD